MIWWILFIAKYFCLYGAIAGFSTTLFHCMNFWTGRVSQAKIRMYQEILCFVLYLMLSNFV